MGRTLSIIPIFHIPNLKSLLNNSTNKQINYSPLFPMLYALCSMLIVVYIFLPYVASVS